MHEKCYLHCHSEAKTLLLVQRGFPHCATLGWSVQYPPATPGHRLPSEHCLVLVISTALEFLVYKETNQFLLIISFSGPLSFVLVRLTWLVQISSSNRKRNSVVAETFEF